MGTASGLRLLRVVLRLRWFFFLSISESARANHKIYAMLTASLTSASDSSSDDDDNDENNNSRTIASATKATNSAAKSSNGRASPTWKTRRKVNGAEVKVKVSGLVMGGVAGILVWLL